MQDCRLGNMKEFWETMAVNYSDYEIPSTNNNAYIKFLYDNKILDTGGTALDIGCGGGKYSFAVSPYFDNVIGIDISDNMIGISNARKEQDGVKNTEFIRLSWQEHDVEQLNWKDKFDFVFAHMTPAINGEETIKKLRYVAKNWCAVTRFVRRKNEVSEEINKICGNDIPSYGENELTMLLKMLWKDGIQPQLFYETDEWNDENTVEKTAESYIKRMSIKKDLTEDEKKKIREYLMSVSVDGIVKEKSDVIMCTVYWQEKKGEKR